MSRSKQAEFSKRGAAAMAHATKGRSRVIQSKRVYDRRKGKGVDQ